MAQFEAKHTYPYIHGKAILFLRCIDDIFMIFNGITEEQILLIDELNKKHETIESGYRISTEKVEFLDTMVYRYQQHKTWTNRPIFRKPTDQQTCMHNQIILNLLKTVIY